MRGACSLQSLFLILIAAGTAYLMWSRWSASAWEGESGPDAVAPALASPPNTQSWEAPANPGVPNHEPAHSLTPLLSPAPDFKVKAIVRRMLDEWKRRSLATERKARGAMLYDMSELLVDLKEQGFYTEQALFREIDRALRALGVPPDQCFEIAASILEQAKLDGEKGKKTGGAALR